MNQLHQLSRLKEKKRSVTESGERLVEDDRPTITPEGT
jgi:hypothetical protein